MKRVLLVLLILSNTLCLCSCKMDSEKFEDPISFYYLTDPVSFEPNAGIFLPERTEAIIFHGNTAEILNRYFSGPVAQGLASPFPAGLSVVTLTRDNVKIMLTLNDAIASLTGLDLSIACTCVALTLIEYTQCQEVEIKAENMLLDGKASITISKENLYLLDIPEASE